MIMILIVLFVYMLRPPALPLKLTYSLLPMAICRSKRLLFINMKLLPYIFLLTI